MVKKILFLVKYSFFFSMHDFRSIIKIERTLCVWLPLTRELAAKLTEGENIEFQLNDIVVYLLPLRFIIA